MTRPAICDPGDVVICMRDAGAPMLRKGALYRVAERVSGAEAYVLEGVVASEFAGFWASRFARAPGTFSRFGPICRHRAPRQKEFQDGD